MRNIDNVLWFVLQHLTLQFEIHIGIQSFSSPEMNHICGVMASILTSSAFIVFVCLTRLGLEATIYCTRGEDASHYTTNVVHFRRRKALDANVYFKLKCQMLQQKPRSSIVDLDIQI
jgi:hypothetical protein